jgi:hypothetical protein
VAHGNRGKQAGSNESPFYNHICFTLFIGPVETASASQAHLSPGRSDKEGETFYGNKEGRMHREILQSFRGGPPRLIDLPQLMYDYDTDGVYLAEEGEIYDHETIALLLAMIKRFYKQKSPQQIENMSRLERERRELARERREERKKPRKYQDHKKCGWVYIIQSPFGYKIGYTANPEVRMKAYGFQITITHVIRSDDAPTIEKYLHDLFAAKRIEGEWFDLSSEDLEYLLNIKVMDRKDVYGEEDNG